MSERYFREEDGTGLQTHEASGLYLVTARQPAGSWPAGDIEGRSVWWQPVPAGATCEREAIETRAFTGLTATALAPASSTAPERRLAVVFADHLARYRLDNPDTNWPCLISPTPPLTPKGFVRLPHLVAVDRGASTEDTVMWEVLKHTDTATWLKQPLPEQSTIEAHLPHILLMRKIVRDQISLDAAPYQEIGRRLAAGRYLSILFVYQHVDLFLELFDSPQWQTYLSQEQARPWGNVY